MITPNEEYKIWKKNASFLYDSVVSHTLEWPSLTVQWSSHKEISKNSKTQELIIGTQTSGQEYEYLMVAEAKMPMFYTEERTMVPKIKVIRKINHKGEVYKARCMPQNESVVATKGAGGIVALYDVSKTDNRNYLFKLTGHVEEGYGLSWSKTCKGLIASCGEDKMVNVWKVDFKNSWGDTSPAYTFKDYQEDVEDVSFNKFSENILLTVGDDNNLRLYDLRSRRNPQVKMVAHDGSIYTCECNPHFSHLMATGGEDNKIKIWDSRKLNNNLCVLENHTDDIMCIDWSKTNEGLLASGGIDRRVMIWDLNRVGMGQTSEDAADGPPELLFVHSGHTANVNDVAFNTADKEEWMVASTSGNNVIQLWEPISTIYKDNNEDVPENELEDLEVKNECDKLWPLYN